MKCFLFLLAIGLTASDKLDRTYLPPPGAQLSGGNPADIQPPLELPNLPQAENIPYGQNLNGVAGFGPTGKPLKYPITTTSYAFSQTTTFPPVENYNPDIIPNNPVNSHFDQNIEHNRQNYGQYLPIHVQNQDNNAQSFENYIRPEDLNSSKQYSVTPGKSEIPGSFSQQPRLNQDLIQYAVEHPDFQNQYTNPDKINQDTIKSPIVQSTDQEFVPLATSSQTSAIGITPMGQYIEAQPQVTAANRVSQSIFSQPINVQSEAQPENNQNYQNQPLLPSNNTPKQQYFNDNANNNNIDSTYQLGQNDFPSSASAHSSAHSAHHPERPQAAADRNAVILNYENILTPNGYSYNYDTSNGIHADETANVDEGTKAKGSYSYTGDDGIVYTVVYTADENGFRPYGDHLPTSPPIPEAIKKVIEQAARDEEAGIIDDGSYDERKYGDHNYHNSGNHYQSPIQNEVQLNSKNVLQEENKRQNTLSTYRVTDGAFDNNQSIGTVGIKHINVKPEDNNAPIVIKNSSVVDRNIIKNNDDANKPFADQNHNVNINTRLNNNDVDHFSTASSFDSPVTGKHNHQNTDYNANDRNYGQQSLPETKPESTTHAKGHFLLTHNNPFENRDSNTNSKQIPTYESPAAPSIDTPLISSRQNQKQSLKSDGRPSVVTNKNFKERIPPVKVYNQEHIGNLDNKPKNVFNNINELPSSPEATHILKDDGYHYDRPQTQSSQTQFPTRFKVEKEVSSYTKPIKNITTKPFQTPEIYNQAPESKQIDDNEITTPEPFMTSRVTTPKGFFTEYEDDDTDDIKNYSPTGDEKVVVGTRRRYKPINTLKSQYSPVEQNGTQDSQNYDDSIKPMQGNKVPFGITESPRKFLRPEKSRVPSEALVPDSSNLVSKPDSAYKYKSAIPISGSSNTAVIPSLSTKAQPSFGSRIPPSDKQTTSQNYPTYTYRPATVFPSANKQRPIDTVKNTVTAEFSPVNKPDSTNNHHGYHYNKPQIPLSPTFGSSQLGTSSDFRQTIYEQNPSDSTLKPNVSINSRVPESSPTNIYQYGTTTPDVVSTIVSSTPAIDTHHRNNSPSPYDYVRPGTILSTISTPSTIGTTPGFSIPSPSPNRRFQSETTLVPVYSSTQNTYNQTPLVDGFGRPINTDKSTLILSPQNSQGSEVPRFGDNRPETPGPSGILSDFNGGRYVEEQSPNVSGYYENPKVKGEDFSGPKQPQRYDSQNGYYYR